LTATYRIQLHPGFRLDDVRNLVPYLDAFGISHAYTSPVLAARAGSTHGYDVIDPTRVNPELGDERALRSLVEELRAHGMGWLLDIVPNHMAASTENPYWRDVLRLGSRSPYARWFDIVWDAPQQWLRGRVMLPVLGDELDRVIERDEIEVVLEEGSLGVRYFENVFPIDPDTEALASPGERDRTRVRALLDAQPYALSFWRRAADQINYRRFFEISDLVAVRQEDPQVFAATHAKILEWVEQGLLDGVRVDHVDGLFDPAKYLTNLRNALDARSASRAGRPPIYVEKILEHDERLRDSWPVAGTTGYEVLNDLESVLIDAGGARQVEDAYRRLLSLGDRGPRFADVARRAKQFVLRHSFESDVRRVARLLTPVLRRRDPAARTSRRAVRELVAQLAAALPVYRTYLDGGPPQPEDRKLIERAESIVRRWGTADTELLARITDVLLREDATDAGDSAQLRRRAIALFQQTSSPAMAKGIEDTALYMYAPLASLNEVGGTPDRDLEHAVERVHDSAAERRARFPGALACTHTHDTKRSADVRARLDVLSEIPDEWERSVRSLRHLVRGARRKLRGRYEPDENTAYLLFQALLGIWPVAEPGGNVTIPDAAAREDLRERLEEYILKAAREAKMRTSWHEPNVDFEAALREYVAALLAEPGPFLDSIAALAENVIRPGFWNALTRILMHVTMPGVPDLYQGAELWNFALVDPDNRRPVDYVRRRAILADLQARFDGADPAARAEYVSELLANVEDGRIKMHLTRQLLRARRAEPALFLEGSYSAVQAMGPLGRHLVIFARAHAGNHAVGFGTRLSRSLTGGTAAAIGDVWGDTRVFLPEPLADVRRWTCVVSGNSVEVPRDAAATGLRVADVLHHLPVALLVRADRPSTAVRPLEP
jgi:malto-oligosyltrehalose synthase